MALAHAQTIARFWSVDREATADLTRLCYPASIAPEAAIGASTGFYAGIISAMSDCRIQTIETEFLYVDDDPAAASLASPDELSQAGAFFFACSPGAADQGVVSIPALRGSCYQADGTIIDPTNAAVADLVAALLAPGPAIVCNPFDTAFSSYTSGARRTIPIEYPEPTG